MNSKIGNIIKYLLFLSIGGVFVYLAFKNIDLKKMWADIMNANFYWVGLSLFFSLLALISRAYRWGMLIEPISGAPKLKYLFYALNAGYATNLAFPRLGEVTRCTVLYKTEKTSVDALIATVIAERVIDVLSLLTLIVITIMVNFKKFGDFFYEKLLKDRLHSLSSLSPVVWILVIGIILFGIIALYVLRKKLLEIAIIKKIAKFLAGILEGLKTVMKLKRKGAFLFHTVFIWAMYYASTYVCFFSLPETSSLSFEAALFILVLGGIGMSAPVNGGIGVYHLLVAAGLTLYGILPVIDPVTQLDTGVGTTFATIVHSSQMLFLVTFGLLSLFLLGLELKKLNKNAA